MRSARSGTVLLACGMMLATSAGASAQTIYQIKPLPSVPAFPPQPETPFFFTIEGSSSYTFSLWTTDGSASGTARLPFVFPFLPNVSSIVGPRVYFVVETGADRGMWASDGTAAGTSLLLGFQGFALAPVPAGGKAVFTVWYSSTGSDPPRLELWGTDGTAAGTTLLQTFTGSEPSYLAAYGPYAYFQVGSPPSQESWRTDGTSAGTVPAPRPPDLFAPHLGDLWFYETYQPHLLWRTDGTAAGTFVVAEFTPHGTGGQGNPIDSVALSQFVSSGGLLYFRESLHEANVGQEGCCTDHPAVWRTDGTAAGTFPVFEHFPYPSQYHGNLGVQSLLAVDGGIAFSYFVPGSLLQIWFSNGTPSGTRLVANPPGVSELRRVGSVVLFGVGSPPALWGLVLSGNLISVDEAAVLEGDEGATTARVTVRLSGPASETVSVGYRTVDGSATAPLDYEPVSGVLSFAPGETAKTVDVVLRGDRDSEPNETVILALHDAVGAQPGSDGRLTILNDDPAPSMAADLDGDHRADILWRHAQGARFVWLMSGTGLTGASYLDPIDTAWRVHGAGDFDGDGRSDLLWRNVSTGETYVWLMNAAHVVGAGYTTIQPDLSWQVAAVADFDGDHRADILWRHTEGDLFFWKMDGTTVEVGTPVDAVPIGWRIDGTADFNGDGKADLLWREAGTGATYIWMLDGPEAIGGTGYTAAQADEHWAIQAVGDLDGDGRADILWRNVGGPDTGALFVWLMDGTGLKGATYLDPISMDWQIQGVADFNGDGKRDILWRNVNLAAPDGNDLYVWMMDGPHVTAGTGYTAAQADQTWQVEVPD